MADSAEGPALRAADDFDGMDEGDEFDGFDEFDGADEGDAGDDEFLGRVVGGAARLAGGLMGSGNAFDESDGFDEFDGFDEADESFDDMDGFDGDLAVDADGADAMEDAVADAMDAGDGDEFFRRLGRIARTVGRGIGSVARVVAPIAAAIPLPQAQLIGRVAGVAGRLLADGADDFEAFDDLVDGLDEDGVDAAAPVLAGMAIRRALPVVARAPQPVRRAAVHAVTTAVRQANRVQGATGARAVARAVMASRQVVAQRGLPARQAVGVVRRLAHRVVRRPQATPALGRHLVPAARRARPRGPVVRTIARVVGPVARRAATSGLGRRHAGRMGCVHCRQRQRLLAGGPVVINLRCR